MRILVIVHGFPPQAQGGSEIYASEHARALAGLGHEVLVLARERDGARPERAVRIERQDRVRVAWVNNTFADTTDFADSYEHPRLAASVLPLIDDFAPHVSHVHHFTCLSTRLAFALADRRVPIVYTLHDYWLMCHRGQLLDRQYRVCLGPGTHGCGRCVGEPTGPMSAVLKASGLVKLAGRTLPPAAVEAMASAARKLYPSNPSADTGLEAARLAHMREVCKRISHFLAPSHHMRDAFVRFGIAEHQITWSPYGFDRGVFKSRRDSTPRSKPLRIGFIGTLMVSKAPHVLLEAYQQLADGSAEVHLHGMPTGYHGDDSYQERLKPLLALPGVHMHGPRPHEGIPDVLANLDVLVVPSIWPENSPLVIQEALLAGVPVVASSTGGIPELITNGDNGLLFQPGDVGELLRILTRLTTEPGALNQLRQTPDTIRAIDEDARASEALYARLLAASTVPPLQRERIAAVVVNYRTPDDTELALRALRASARLFDDIVVVNNDSEVVPSHLQRLATSWVHTGSNLGFSGGVNAGIRRALTLGATHVMLVNSDVTVPPDVLDRLRLALDEAPGAGIAGPVIASRTRPDEIASAGIRYDRRTGRMRHLEFGTVIDAAFTARSHVVDAVSGCVMLVRRDIFERVGFFEEAYFYGFEDIDFCLGAGRAGYATVLSGNALVYHHGGQSIGSNSVRRLYFGARNHLLLAARVSGNDSRIVRLTRGAMIIGFNAAHALTSPGGSAVSRLRAVARGVADYASGTFGPDR